jgi:hypothetical protein
MRGIEDAAFSITTYYSNKSTEVMSVNEGTPIFRNIHWSDAIVTDSNKAAVIEGLPEMPVQEISLSNIIVENSATGIECTYGSGLVLNNVVVNSTTGPALIVRDVRDIDIERFTSRRPDKEQPIIQLERVDGAWIHSCKAAEGTGTFLNLYGKLNRNIYLNGNRLSKSNQEIEYSEGASEAAFDKVETT